MFALQRRTNTVDTYKLIEPRIFLALRRVSFSSNLARRTTLGEY